MILIVTHTYIYRMTPTPMSVSSVMACLVRLFLQRAVKTC